MAGMQIDQDKIEKAIVAGAVDAVIHDDDLFERVKRGIDARIDKIFVDKVQSCVEVAVEHCVKSGFEREYRKIDSFGRPTGEPTSISKELETLISRYWTDRVNAQGKKVEDGAYNSVSRAEWMMTKICADDFSKEMKQHVVNVSGALKDHFRAVLNSHVASMLSGVFKVQSQGDRDLKRRDASCIHPPAKSIGS